jgi:hypothetical protein
VSISVVGMMMEPGSGFDNFDANEIKVKLIIEISKPAVPNLFINRANIGGKKP